ncbi:MAG: HU family DNA-binding protein [Tannerella sp.]|jgi:predicted histone-like DNA-binding protein|nr:HU family DNA-binding protein [Tannerella sp.]
MAIRLKKIQKENPQDRKQSKWYLVQVHSGTVTLQDIAREIADRSSLSIGDVENVLANLVEVLPIFLKLNQTIRLEGFGSFHISVQSTGAEKAEDLTTNNVKNAKIVFIPSTELKGHIEHLSFEIIKEE